MDKINSAIGAIVSQTALFFVRQSLLWVDFQKLCEQVKEKFKNLRFHQDTIKLESDDCLRKLFFTISGQESAPFDIVRCIPDCLIVSTIGMDNCFENKSEVENIYSGIEGLIVTVGATTIEFDFSEI